MMTGKLRKSVDDARSTGVVVVGVIAALVVAITALIVAVVR